jgi:hypothetical protein
MLFYVRIFLISLHPRWTEEGEWEVLMQGLSGSQIALLATSFRGGSPDFRPKGREGWGVGWLGGSALESSSKYGKCDTYRYDHEVNIPDVARRLITS